LVSVNDIDVAFRNSTNWTFVDASAACYAAVSDFISHNVYVLN